MLKFIKNKNKKIVIITASSFGYYCLKYLSNKNYCIVANVITYKTHTYEKKKRNNIFYENIKKLCKDKKIPITILKNKKDELNIIKKIKKIDINFILLCGWYHKLSYNWFNSFDIYALHSSLLPKFAGGAPLVWSIIKGEKFTGISFFKVNKVIDGGPIVTQSKLKINNLDTIKTLSRKIKFLTFKIFDNFISKIILGNIILKKQNLNKRTYFYNRSPQDGLINFCLSSKYIFNFIRAQTKPYPGAFFYLNKYKITIWEAQIVKKFKYLNLDNNKFIIHYNNQYFIRLNNRHYIKLLKISINDLECNLKSLNNKI